MKAQIRSKDIEHFAAGFDKESRNRLAQNAVTSGGIRAVATNRSVLNRNYHVYSHLIPTPEATNQKVSGRCWLFAGLNILRLAAMEKMKLDSFELSQTYLMFWDKLEKANYFLESIIATCDEPLDGRLVAWLLADPVPDGGQWDMFVNLVEKYGVVPKAVMRETYSSSASKTMNADLEHKLRGFAQQLRDSHAQGASVDELRQAKRDMLETMYRMISIHLGSPPAQFVWEWRDKDKNFHRQGTMTPQAFLETFAATDLDQAVCLINAPTAGKPFRRTFTVQYLGNVVSGRPVRYLNVDLPALKQAAVDMIVDKQPVWFGCDVGQMLERQEGVLDPQVFDYESIYGAPFELDKAGRLDYGQSQMTHAMVLTGVDLGEDGKPLSWRVENSWGDRFGDKGYLTMSDAWFDEYLYEITIYKKYLPAELLQALETEPIVLPPWDPMGALAGAE